MLISLSMPSPLLAMSALKATELSAPCNVGSDEAVLELEPVPNSGVGSENATPVLKSTFTAAAAFE